MPQPRRDPAFWLAVVALAVLLVGSTAVNVRADDLAGPAALGVLLAAGALLPALLPLPPAVALPVGGLLTGAYFTAGYADGPVFLALPVLTFVHALRASPRRWGPPAALAALLAAGGLGLREVLHDVSDVPSGWQAVGLTAMVAAAGAIGAALRSRRSAAAERSRRAAGEERLRMAADLHDGVGHGLAVIAMQAGAALHVLDRDTEAARASLEAIRATSRESLELLRGQLARLSEPDAAPRTPMPGLADLPTLVDRVRAGGVSVDLAEDPALQADVTGVAPDVGRAAYAVVQEGLTNVLRHAGASRASVSLLVEDGGLVVTVEDDGRGAAAGRSPGGLGLVGMRTRVEALGGTLDAGPAERGFRVRARIPLHTGVRS